MAGVTEENAAAVRVLVEVVAEITAEVAGQYRQSRLKNTDTGLHQNQDPNHCPLGLKYHLPQQDLNQNLGLNPGLNQMVDLQDAQAVGVPVKREEAIVTVPLTLVK